MSLKLSNRSICRSCVRAKPLAGRKWSKHSSQYARDCSYAVSRTTIIVRAHADEVDDLSNDVLGDLTVKIEELAKSIDEGLQVCWQASENCQTLALLFFSHSVILCRYP
jgi:hypothetical protein